ncbi:MAG: FecR domain-containing protein [Planctomycetota bacterium]
MNPPVDQARLLRACGDLCNGLLPGDEATWLDGVIAADAEACQAYVDYMTMHATLHFGDLAAGGESYSALTPTISALVDAPASADSNNAMLGLGGIDLAETEVGSSKPTPPRKLSSWFVVAASLVAVAVTASLLTAFALQRNPRLIAAVDTSPNENGRPAVARVTGTQNCLWSRDAIAFGYGSQLRAGQQLDLVEGLAEITFEDGATVLLEGPARFVVEDRHGVGLKRGRLAAVVPRRARGFRVHTDSIDVYDVGTEFGMFARESGAAEVHVFNGLLKAELLDASGQTQQKVELNASEAIRVSPVSTTVMEFPADEAAFVRTLLPKSGPQDGLLTYEGFDYPSGPLSAQNGGFGWAGPWFSISEAEEGLSSNMVGMGSVSTEGLVPKGNHAALTGQANRIRRSLATSVGGVYDVAGLVENQDGVRLIGRDGQQVYLSFVQRVSDTDNGFYGFELHRGDGNPNRVLCIGNGAEETAYGVTSNFNIYGSQNFPALGQENDEANLFVVKISFGVGNRDLVSVYRNPESLRDEQACVADVQLKGNFAFDRISLANFDGEKTLESDEIRVGTHFLAVTGRWGSERGRLMRRVTLLEDRRQRAAFGVHQLVLLDPRVGSRYGPIVH